MNLLPQVLATAFTASRFTDPVRFALDWAPEIKHEGLVTTSLSAYLRSIGVQSRREVSLSKRRIDLYIGSSAIEAKYHFEGDLLEIERNLRNNATHGATAWNSATNAILGELARGRASYFLWLVCIRSPDMPALYKLSHLIEPFYLATGAPSLSAAASCAEQLLDATLLPLLQQRTALTHFWLPNIMGQHSCIVPRLYYFPARDEA